MEQLAKALVNLRKTLKNPKKSSKGYNWRYADLVEINNSIDEALQENSLTYYQTPESIVNDGKYMSGIKTVVLHESGEFIENLFLAPPKSYDEKDLGGQQTYFRRYALLAMFGLAPSDDGENNPEKNDDRKIGGKAISDKQLALLRTNFDKLTQDEVGLLESKTMGGAQASTIIGEILNGKR
jgi:hypothetical protein